MQSTSQPQPVPDSCSTDPQTPNRCLEQINALEAAVVQLDAVHALVKDRADALLHCQAQTLQPQSFQRLQADPSTVSDMVPRSINPAVKAALAKICVQSALKAIEVASTNIKSLLTEIR